MKKPAWMFCFLGMFAVMFCTSATEGQTQDLLGKWSFEENLDNGADPSLPARSGQNLSYTQGVSGKALELSGKYQIQIPPQIIPADLQQFTFTAWVAPKNSSEVYHEILRKEDRHLRILFSFQEKMKILSLGFYAGGQYSECDAPISPEEILDGAWHFVAATFDGQIARVYFDGLEIAAADRGGALQTIVSNHSQEVGAPIFIGSMTGSGEFFQGRMDELSIYRRALSAEEIFTLAQSGDSKLAQKLRLAKEQTENLYKKSDGFWPTFGKIRENRLRDDKVSSDVSSKTHAILLQNLRRDFPEEFEKISKIFYSPWASALWEPAPILLEKTKDLAQRYTEYLPITDAQWSVLSAGEKARWERVRDMKNAYQTMSKTPESADSGKLLEVVCQMIINTPPRPRQEHPAPYKAPSTPEVVDLTQEEAEAILRREWLFQCDGNPTVARTLQEIQWTRDLAARIESQHPGKISFAATLEVLSKYESEAKMLMDQKGKNEKNEALYFHVRRLKREILFANPVVDFDSVLYLDSPFPEGREWNHETRHRQGYMAVPGGRLMILKGLSPAGKQTKLMPQEPLHGSFWRPDLSFDAKKVLVSFKPANEKAFHLYEIGIDGSGLRQLTGGMFDDLDPIYLQDGKHIMFLTTRGHLYVRCMPPTSAFVMARMELGSDDVYIISRNGEPEYTPSVMNDGRIIYTRWEYTDKPLWRCQSLWTMNSDGTQVQTFWGNQSVWPDLLKDARSIPGSEKIMFTGSAHHNWFSGSVGIIDPRKGFNFPDGLTKITADVKWPECGNGPVDPIESAHYHPSGRYSAYYSPYPLSETDFIVSAYRNGKFVLLLMDTDGNRDLIYEGTHQVLHALPIRPRSLPPQYPDRVMWPTREERFHPGTGIIYSNNVYDGMPEEVRGKAKFLRILMIEHKTYTYWNQRPYASSGPETSMVQSEGVKRVLGTVPIEADGSVSFVAPTGVALHFQLLDEHQRALQTMRSFTGVLPGEVRGCLGCHESHVRTPVRRMTGQALLRAPSQIKPVSWEDNSISYERYVQPVLDKYCGKCHQNPDHDAYKAINLTLRPGMGTFKEPYITLTGRPTWGQAYKMPENPSPGFGWADTILVEAYDQRDPAAYQTVPPMTKLSYRSRLVERMMSGTHHNVQVKGEDLQRVILWVDAMCPYRGAEEVRSINDPQFEGVDWISVRPRIKTAPYVQRPGPFDAFHTDEDEVYAPPKEINVLPPGILKEREM
ncbi:MAG: LamG-like jellyroll fold domain-containing protein [Planctomycetia bacterium]|nr:LamG-like jellyroll fold domain-containing protein [Planctomycetia bacterium]